MKSVHPSQRKVYLINVHLAKVPSLLLLFETGKANSSAIRVLAVGAREVGGLVLSPLEDGFLRVLVPLEGLVREVSDGV